MFCLVLPFSIPHISMDNSTDLIQLNLLYVMNSLKEWVANWEAFVFRKAVEDKIYLPVYPMHST